MEDSIEYLVNNFPGIAVIIDDEYKIRRGNQIAYEAFGKLGVKRPDEYRFKPLTDIHTLDGSTAIDALRTGSPFYGYKEYKWKNRKRRILYCHLPTKINSSSRGVVILNIDFKKKINTLEDLVESFKANSHIYFSELEICLFDLEGKLNYVNRSVVNNSGLEAKDLIGESIKFFFDSEEEIELLLKRIALGNFVHTKKYINNKKSKDHLSRVVELISFPIIINGEMIGGIYLGLNLGGLIKHSDRIKKFNKIEDAGRMAFRVIHEVRNPLQEILAIAELGKINSNNEQTNLYFDSIKERIEQINNLMNEILELSNFHQLELFKYNINDIFSEILKEVFENCKKEKIKLEVELEDLEIKIDKSLFSKIILNLLNNAIEVLTNYEQNRKISIKAESKDNEVLFSIYNSGPEIPEKIREYIFDIFASTKGRNGTGLGLTITYYIVTRIFKGDIWFESNQEGTTFFFKIKQNIDKTMLISKEDTAYKGI
ncbi:ATP-binding protein [Orenia marismortui]|uniref:histidine kinase n=1 Tax=Orenia marismortui TaxID=46469 RepID=A0A4R8GYT2_9FIRM|nr:PAS domain-containing sensor histidine kinase [Orenia marismortui]TDX51663.1 PAS domain S-box-containing protein [Orenia marismortui]